MTEQEKWNAFISNQEYKLQPHKKNLPSGCTGCNVNRLWNAQDIERLVDALHVNSSTICDVARALDRTIHGVTSKARQIGIFAAPTYKEFNIARFNKVLSMRRIRFVLKEKLMQDALTESLTRNGWEWNDAKNCLRAPQGVANEMVRRGSL